MAKKDLAQILDGSVWLMGVPLGTHFCRRLAFRYLRYRPD